LAKAGGYIAGGPKTEYDNLDHDDRGLPRIKEALEATTTYTNPGQRGVGGGGPSNASAQVSQTKQKQQLTGLKQRLKKKQQAVAPPHNDQGGSSNNDAAPFEVNLTMDGISIGGTSSNYRGAHDSGLKNEAKEQQLAREINLQYLDNELISVINSNDKEPRDARKKNLDKVAPAPLKLDMKIVPAPLMETKVCTVFSYVGGGGGGVIKGCNWCC
jgi:hypothetical protein